MGILQLVEHDSSTGRDYEAVPNPDAQPTAAFRDDHTRPVLWGSSDLLDVAIKLREQGFYSVDLTLSDEHLSPLPDSETADIKEDLLEHLNKDTDADALSERLDYLVLAVTVRRKGLGAFRIFQNGGIQILPSSNQEGFLHSLRQAISATG